MSLCINDAAVVVAPAPGADASSRARAGVLLAVAASVTATTMAVPAGASSTPEPGSALQRALDAIVARSYGPPGIIVVVQRGATQAVYRAVLQFGQSTRIQTDEHLRLASVAEAYSGATAPLLVPDGVLSLDDTVGKWLPERQRK